MKLSRTAWLVLGISLFVVAAVVLYVFYNNQVNQRQEAKDTLAVADEELQALYVERAALEGELADVEAGLAQWQAEIEQMEEELAQAVADSGQAHKGFPVSIDGIECEEILFAMADNSDVVITRLSSGGEGASDIEDIAYTTTSFSIEVQGQVLDILGYINAIVIDDSFKTAVIAPINLTVPDSLNDEQKEQIAEGIRESLLAEALAEITKDQIVGFTLESIDEVAGDEFINILTNPEGLGAGDGQIDALNIDQMAENIRQKIADCIYIEQEYEGLLSGELAELIAEQIAGSVINKVVGSMAEGISALIVEMGEGYIYDDLVDLLGEDIAQLLGDDLAGGISGNISGLLQDYIAGLIEAKMLDSVAATVEISVGQLVEERVEELETPSASIELVIYAYPVEGGIDNG